MLRPASITSSVLLLALLAGYTLAVQLPGTGLIDADTDLNDPDLTKLEPSKKKLLSASNSESDPDSNSDDDNDGNEDDSASSPTTRYITILTTEYGTYYPTGTPTSREYNENGTYHPMGIPTPREYDENAPALKAEVIGMARFKATEESGDEDDFLIVVDEFKDRNVVRQSVCYNTLRSGVVRMGYVAFCYDMSDYDMVSGNPETMTSDQFYLLRDRVEGMLEDEDGVRKTMGAFARGVFDSLPYSVVFRGFRWSSIPIRLGDDHWSDIDTRTRPSDKPILTWKPPYEVSRLILPYHWDEPRRLDRDMARATDISDL